MSTIIKLQVVCFNNFLLTLLGKNEGEGYKR